PTHRAHGGDTAGHGEVPAARRIPAVLASLRVALLRLLDLAADGRQQDVAAQADAPLLQRAHRLHVAGQRALHVRDAEAVEAAVALERLRLEPRHVAEPRLTPRVRGVHVAVEHEGGAAARAGPRAEAVRAAVLDPLPPQLKPDLLEKPPHALGHR